MANNEYLRLIEEVLQLAPGSLSEETELSALSAWDSLTILSLQIRLTAIKPDLQFSDLFGCATVGEILQLL